MAEADGVRTSEIGLAVPPTLMVWGEAAALSVSMTVSESAPETVPEGEKITEMVHEALATSAAFVQVLLFVK